MRYNYDPMYTVDCFEKIVNIPSPLDISEK